LGRREIVRGEVWACREVVEEAVNGLEGKERGKEVGGKAKEVEGKEVEDGDKKGLVV
jgi:hypothetical protein